MKGLVSCALLVLVFSTTVVAADAPLLVDNLAPILSPLLSGTRGFSLRAEIEIPDGADKHTIKLDLDQIDDDSFDLAIEHQDYAVAIRRRADRTEFVLPKHNKTFVGRGEINGKDSLRPLGITQRLVGSGTKLSTYLPLVTNGDPQVVALLLTGILKVQYDHQTESWSNQKEVSLRFSEPGVVSLEVGDVRVRLRAGNVTKTHAEVAAKQTHEIVEIDRIELERQLVRGVRRAFEILAPSAKLTLPAKSERKVANGELRWINGQRIALLRGTPEEIGQAHGQLLKKEARRCIDSVLYTFGTAETIRSGSWFRHELESAYERLAPYIPEDHKRETRAMAASLQLEPRLIETLNVFPELFHCSGFAVFGKATKDGKLYHGRVLDYMTTIGLQDAATTFIVAVDDKIPFANIGYAGFIGSVSGMNSQAISLGEMGGRGEGEWDGVPMATLMRRALEECSTLDEVKQLWTTNPRTCEYFYVFADGKTNDAVGVSATPGAVEFIAPGQAHERLGEGIEDAVVLSAGDRLKTLRSRVQERYGEIDVEVAKWLMSRPVAMQSNLHNVLFVPQDGLLYVANADHKHPAAERPYVRLDLRALLAEMTR
ncbi:MAG: peptidase C45 acyl-coenzyme A:6-aminopenicillanic acid acyl-transferase [Planctomycetaceae bacterium]|nr:peptidase C45 acyl-coenzyme A:6-aminopenicillanic acid acyl-transferase [Planctomycetaceae bacterium]